MDLRFFEEPPGGRLRFQVLRTDPEVFVLTQIIAQERGVAMSKMLRFSRGSGRAASARQLAIYLSHILLERPQDVVGHLFSRDRSTVVHSVNAIEDRRDDPKLEAEIARIEARLREVFPAPEVKHAA